MAGGQGEAVRKRQINDLVDRCADLAVKGPKVCAYVILYAEKNGDMHTARGGNLASQVGLLAVAKEDLLTALSRQPESEGEDA